jgi:phage major head subunit gpT-like protein
MTRETHLIPMSAEETVTFAADEGRKLGVTPTVMVVPPELESAALALLNTEFGPNGESNIWKGTAQLIVMPYL